MRQQNRCEQEQHAWRGGPRLARRWPIACLALLLFAACSSPPASTGPAEAAFARITALQGDWLDADAVAGTAVNVVATYRVTAGGSTVVETLFPGMPEEMMSTYVRERDDIVLMHYCSTGNQPQLRARVPASGPVKVLDFDLAGGTGFDPARDMHMHSMRLQFVSANEIRADWEGWEHGKPDPAHMAHLHLVRKP